MYYFHIIVFSDVYANGYTEAKVHMNVTRSARKRIQQLRSRRGLAGDVGLRIELKAGAVRLKWETGGPKDDDLVVTQWGFPVFIDAGAYLRLSSYVLDFRSGRRTDGFLLRPISGDRSDGTPRNGGLSSEQPKDGGFAGAS